MQDIVNQDRACVIVPCLNAASTLMRALASLNTQVGGPPHIVVVDDGSDDSTLQMAEAYAREHQGVHILALRHGGVSRARNAGLEYAIDVLKVEYVGFMDSDDYVQPGHLEGMLRVLDSGVDIVALQAPRYSIRASRTSPIRGNRSEPTPARGVPTCDYLGGLVRLERPTSVWAYMFRSTVVRGVRFDPAIAIFEDIDFLVGAISRVSIVGLLTDSTYEYEIQSKSANRQPMSGAWISSIAAFERVAASPRLRKRDVDVFGAHLVTTLFSLVERLPAWERSPYIPPVQRLAKEVFWGAIFARRYRMIDRIVVICFAIHPGLLLRLVSVRGRRW